MLHRLDPVAISAIVNFVSGLLVLWMMQRVTSGAGFYSYLGIVKLGHRLVLAVLAVALVANAGFTTDSQTAPRFIDLVTQFLFLLVLVISAVRHSMAPNDTPADERPATIFRLH